VTTAIDGMRYGNSIRSPIVGTGQFGCLVVDSLLTRGVPPADITATRRATERTPGRHVRTLFRIWL
jgi:hypothetical protein